jgi:hypothetical protein
VSLANRCRDVAAGKIKVHPGLQDLLPERTLRDAADEIERLQAIVDSISQTADGIPVVLGKTRVFYVSPLGDILTGIPYALTIGITCDSAPHFRCAWDRGSGAAIGDALVEASSLFTTREAAEAAKAETAHHAVTGE